MAPVLDQFPLDVFGRVCCHPIQDHAVVRAKPREHGHVVRSAEDVDRIQLQEAELTDDGSNVVLRRSVPRARPIKPLGRKPQCARLTAADRRAGARFGGHWSLIGLRGSGPCQNSGPRASLSSSYISARKCAVIGHGRLKMRISAISLSVLRVNIATSCNVWPSTVPSNTPASAGRSSTCSTARNACSPYTWLAAAKMRRLMSRPVATAVRNGE